MTGAISVQDISPNLGYLPLFALEIQIYKHRQKDQQQIYLRRKSFSQWKNSNIFLKAISWDHDFDLFLCMVMLVGIYLMTSRRLFIQIWRNSILHWALANQHKNILLTAILLKHNTYPWRFRVKQRGLLLWASISSSKYLFCWCVHDLVVCLFVCVRACLPPPIMHNF